MIAWIAHNWGEVLQSAGVVGALFFSGLGFLVDARVRRAQTHLELTKQHRDLHSYIRSIPESSGLYDVNRDLSKRPLLEMETYLVNQVLHHMHGAFRAGKARLFVLPTKLRLDVRQFMARPVPRSAWNELRPYHEDDFVAFVEKSLGE